MNYIQEFHKILASLFENMDIKSLFSNIGIISGVISIASVTISSFYKEEIILFFKRSKKNKIDNIAISLTYINFIKKNNLSIAMVTSVCILCIFSLREMLHQSRYIYIFTVIVVFNLFLIEKIIITEYRIRKGLFGTNRTEARELIDFIIKNSDNLDFTDSNGNLRRALLPEAKDAVEEHIPGTLGEEARA